MKKMMLLGLCALVMVGCKNEQAKTDNTMINMRDSLNKIIEQKNNEINDFLSVINEVEEGFKEINEAQGRVSVAKTGEGTNHKQLIRENVEFIQQTLRQNKALIAKLKQQLRESSISSEALKQTIENLVSQLEEKDKQIHSLLAELDSKDIHINELNEDIANLNSDVNTLTEEDKKKTQTINNQDAALNAAWFVYGTKSELKAQNILVDGKVLQDNFNKDYFTKIDIRVDKEIKLYSRSAKMLTSHPSSSYTLQKDANKQYVLRITNPQLFWSTSKYLVILVK